MKKVVSLLAACALVLSLAACGTPAAPEVSDPPEVSPAASAEPSAPVVPVYTLINSDKYVRDGKECLAYRVEIGDGATEEDMRAVFGELSAADSYYLHTVWFYGLASDVEAVGACTVGELEEEAPGEAPVFTASTYDAETIMASHPHSGGIMSVRPSLIPTAETNVAHHASVYLTGYPRGRGL